MPHFKHKTANNSCGQTACFISFFHVIHECPLLCLSNRIAWWCSFSLPFINAVKAFHVAIGLRFPSSAQNNVVCQSLDRVKTCIGFDGLHLDALEERCMLNIYFAGFVCGRSGFQESTVYSMAASESHF